MKVAQKQDTGELLIAIELRNKTIMSEINYTKHETAIIDDGGGAQIGDKVIVGNNVKIQNNVSVYDNVTLEDDVFCGPSMVFTNVYNPRSAIVRKHEYCDTLVKKGATLGANCANRNLQYFLKDGKVSITSK